MSTASTLSDPAPERHVFPLRATIGIPLGDVSNGPLPPREDATLWCAALRYPVFDAKQRAENRLTLVLTHGLSSHKESYHLTVARLLQLYSRSPCSPGIREIWSIDLPNHGESAVLNRAFLDERKERGRREGWEGSCTTMDYTTYLNAFLSVPQLRGHRVVGIAHSGSCTAWTRALTTCERSHTHPFALVFIEPTLMFPGMDPKDPRSIHGAANVRGALAKRDRWSSREEARRWLLGIKGGDVEKEKKVGGISSEHGEKKDNRDNLKEKGKTIWSRWDERAVTLFVDYAFEDIREPATSEIPNASPASSPISFTTPKLRKDEESSLYPCLQHTIEPSKLAILSSILSSDAGKSHSARGNLHFIWAEIEEFVSKSARAEMVDAAEHRVMSQQIVKGTGHLIPQEQPDALADALYNVLVSHIAVAAGHTMRASL